MTHAELQAAILMLARQLGLHVHACPMLTSSPGFPDLVIIGRRRVLWRELKVEPDTLSSEQRALGYTLQASGQDWAVWWSAGWESGLIGYELEAIA